MLISAGILLYKVPDTIQEDPQIFLVRANHVSDEKELWGVPKGRSENKETLLETARREFQEETGIDVPKTSLTLLPSFVTSYGKRIHIFTGEVKNTEDIKWNKDNVKYTSGKRNGRLEYYQETRDGQWFPFSVAYDKIGRGQRGILELFRKHHYGF